MLKMLSAREHVSRSDEKTFGSGWLMHFQCGKDCMAS